MSVKTCADLTACVLVCTVLVIGLFSSSPASADEDSWCTSWKNQQMCGSVEYFQTFAKRECLQAQAKRNVTIDESIALHGDCQAAMIMAKKAELAKTARERALAAQKELDAMPH